jgi:hypothetical protein
MTPSFAAVFAAQRGSPGSLPGLSFWRLAKPAGRT